MATLAAGADRQDYVSDQTWFTRLAWVLAVIIVFGFAQHAALGRVDYATVPVWVHMHGIVMLGWLALFVNQNRLAGSGNLPLHRRMGWAGAFLVCLIVGITCFSGVMAVGLHRQPPFFTPPYFLALAQIDALAFAGLVFAGISNRGDTQTHRRLISGASVVILEPAFGRLLPMPIIGGTTGEWLIMVIQLGIVAAMALHDRKVMGRIHPATFSVAVVVALAHVLVGLAAQSGPVIRLAGKIAGTV
jgi:hypothetical protein